MAFGAIAGIAGGLLGALAGGQADKGRQRTFQDVHLKDIKELNKGRSDLEAAADTSQLDQFNQLQALLSQGPGQAEVTAGLQSQNDLAALIQSTLAQGGLPNQTQVGQAQTFASQIFDPQRVALQQSFQDQDIAYQRLAARLGRSGADPVLRNKLAQEQTRQLSLLNSQQGAFAAEQAMSQPQRQLQLAEALAQVRGGLASQALQNRQTLLGLGNQLAASERQYRLSAVGRSSDTTTTSGGGLGGAISGGLAGIGIGAGTASLFGSFGSGSQSIPRDNGAGTVAGPQRMLAGF